MYKENNVTFESVQKNPKKGLVWNGKRYAYHIELPSNDIELADNEVVLTPWEKEWNDWSITDDDVIIFTQKEITKKLQSPDEPLNTW